MYNESLNLFLSESSLPKPNTLLNDKVNVSTELQDDRWVFSNFGSLSGGVSLKDRAPRNLILRLGIDLESLTFSI
jgi:hypothetical protein